MNDLIARMRTAPIFFLCAFLSVAVLSAASPVSAKPHIVIIATGGTIAAKPASQGSISYTPGTVGVQELIDSVPHLKDMAEITGQQLVNIGSQDMTNAIWLKLARRVNELLTLSDVNGVVITHGRDTLEETAYFLDLVVKSDKPVVMTGAMRPATALGADGPLNLFDAVVLATSPQAKGRGVLIVMNDEIHYAREATKRNNMKLKAVTSPNRGPAGLVMTGRAFLFAGPTGRHTTQSQFQVETNDELPRVEVLYAYTNMGRELIDNVVAIGARGIVVASVGNGNMTRAAIDGLAEAAKRGVAVVRSSRTESGAVVRNLEIDDDALGFIASMELNPQKARVLLMLGLMQTNDPGKLQALFYQY